MAEHPIQGLMNVTMDKIRQMADSNTIIGKPIKTDDGTTILPVSRISFGFASAGTDFDGKNVANKDLFGGGSGAGVNIQPVAFLVVKDGCVRTIQLSDNADTINRALTMLPELVDKVLAAYKEAGIEAHGYVCDVTNEDAVNEMVKKITAEVGHINVLVNNAGIIKRIPMIEMTAAQFRQVIDVDLNAPFIVAKAVIPDMIEQGGGKIINICSMMSELGRETVSAYAAAKGGLKMLTKNIASEYGEYNIQCNGIGPGYIATAQTAPLREVQPDGSRHPFAQFITATPPAGRWGAPDALVGPCVFLASEASDFVNGLILYVDGGILAYIGKQPG